MNISDIDKVPQTGLYSLACYLIEYLNAHPEFKEQYEKETGKSFYKQPKKAGRK